MKAYRLILLAALAIDAHAVGFAGAAGSDVATAPTPEQFAWQQAITVSGGEAIYRFELPQAVYQGALRRDLGDLRIFNAGGEVVPHALLHYTPPAETSRQNTALNYFPLYRASATAGDTLSIDVRRRSDGSLISARVDAAGSGKASQAPQLAGYVIDGSVIKSPVVALLVDWQPTAQGTVMPVQVEASDDLQAWRRVAHGAQLVDLSFGGQRLRRNRIELDGSDGSSARYWRLSWPAQNEALTLTSLAAETSSQTASARPLHWSPVADSRAGEKKGEFLFETGGLPVEQLRLTLPQANTVAPLRLFHRASAQERWREAANTVAYRLQRDGVEVLAPPIAVCCSGDRFWLLTVDQRGGGIGSGLPQIELAWVAQQGLFVARGAAPFRLAYGSRLVTPTGFGPATLVPGYRPEDFPKLAAAQLGPAERVANAPAASAPAFANWRTVGLWSVLVLGVLALGGMAWKLLREMNGKSNQA